MTFVSFSWKLLSCFFPKKENNLDQTYKNGLPEKRTLTCPSGLPYIRAQMNKQNLNEIQDMWADPVNGPEPCYDYLVQIRLKNIHKLYVLWWSRTGPDRTGTTTHLSQFGRKLHAVVNNEAWSGDSDWIQRGPAACVLSPFHRAHTSSPPPQSRSTGVEMKVQVCSECESRWWRHVSSCRHHD